MLIGTQASHIKKPRSYKFTFRCIWNANFVFILGFPKSHYVHSNIPKLQDTKNLKLRDIEFLSQCVIWKPLPICYQLTEGLPWHWVWHSCSSISSSSVLTLSSPECLLCFTFALKNFLTSLFHLTVSSVKANTVSCVSLCSTVGAQHTFVKYIKALC